MIFTFDLVLTRREAWLGKMTMQRLDQLNQLNKEVAECVQKLRWSTNNVELERRQT